MQAIFAALLEAFGGVGKAIGIGATKVPTLADQQGMLKSFYDNINKPISSAPGAPSWLQHLGPDRLDKLFDKNLESFHKKSEALFEAELHKGMGKGSENLELAMTIEGTKLALRGLGDVITHITHPTLIFTDALSLATKPMQEIAALGKEISQFVEKADPAAAFMYNYELENLVATIGVSLSPLMRRLTDDTSKLADVYARLRPVTDQLVDATIMLTDQGMEALVDSAEAAAPYMKLLAEQIQQMAIAAKLFGPPTWLFKYMTGFGGLVGGWDPDGKGDVAARMGRTFTGAGSAENIQREVAQQSVISSMGGEGLRDTNDILEDILDEIKKDPVGGAACIIGGILGGIDRIIPRTVLGYEIW